MLSDEKSKQTMVCYLEGHINLKEYPMREIWKKEDVISQYFPNDIIYLDDKEVFVDCGAYTGETYNSFSSLCKNYKKYYAIEPDIRRVK